VDELNRTKCDKVRELLTEILDDTSDLSANSLAKSKLEVEGEPVAVHLEQCTPCQTWRAQTDEIVDMARMLPQFDVSESLTQSILMQVSSEDKARQQQLGWIVYAMAIGLFFYTMLFVDAFESVWGIGSWGVGLATMVGLKLLISEPKKERQVV
jgi:predicted anti-sigma-YlaC factor YlaD